MSEYEKNLIGRSIPLDEVDDDENDLDYLIPEAEINADFIEIINNLGEEEFKFIFLNLYNEIKSLPFERQKELCQKLNDKIFEIYEFEFSPSLQFENQDDIDNFLNFIEFLEYDYIDIIAKIITDLDLNLLKKDPDKFLEDNYDIINSRINNLTENGEIIGLISIFLRTNNKLGLISFLQKRIVKDKMLIIFRILEGEYQNEWYDYNQKRFNGNF